MLPSGPQWATEMSFGARPASQVPTSGWLAISLAASWAAAGRAVVARARPRPPAPRPARAVRRVTVSRVLEEVMRWLLLLQGWPEHSPARDRDRSWRSLRGGRGPRRGHRRPGRNTGQRRPRRLRSLDAEAGRPS